MTIKEIIDKLKKYQPEYENIQVYIGDVGEEAKPIKGIWQISKNGYALMIEPEENKE